MEFSSFALRALKVRDCSKDKYGNRTGWLAKKRRCFFIWNGFTPQARKNALMSSSRTLFQSVFAEMRMNVRFERPDFRTNSGRLTRFTALPVSLRAST